MVAAASETGGVVTNGMSEFRRDAVNANAALLVTLEPASFPVPGPLGGMYWQRRSSSGLLLPEEEITGLQRSWSAIS